ncbi:MAG: GntR family transcriptional regulator [Lachnospiraceae bacterium]|jgi:DNA-binding GntR family transcriptional regulator
MQAGQKSKEDIYNELKEQILTLQAVPHEKLSENSIASRSDVSRTIVRGAFSRLTEEGLLTVLPQSGTFVSFISMKKVQQTIFAYNTILSKLIEEICGHRLSQEEEKKLQTTEVEMQSLSKDTDEKMRRDAQLVRLLSEMSRREYVVDFLNSINFDLLRVMRLSYDTFAINTFSYYSSPTSESMEVIIRMLFNYIRDRDVFAAQMLIQNRYNSVMFKAERLREMYNEYFSG